FRAALGSGVPVLIRGVHRRLQKHWTPEALMASIDEAMMTCIECNSSKENRVTMPAKAFFEQLSPNAQPGAVYKVKDWPPDRHFKDVFRQHYRSFNQAFPDACADFVRADGAANIAACWPDTEGAPDLGPKMYAAMANRENGEGTTRLHLDVTDAANLMVWAADPSRPAARWHIFRQGDADRLREAVWASKWCAEADHPIHSQ
ncbi:hypothetical protein C8Q76DRAFT_588987, partial [Earliella scabrosa]